MRTLTTALITLGALAGSQSVASAQGVPVHDNSNLVQAIATLEQMVTDYEHQLEQYTVLLEQVTTLQSQLESITGARGISDILNSASDIAGRASADGLGDILDAAIAGTEIAGNAGQITGRIGEFKDLLDLNQLADFLGSEIPQDRALATTAGAGLTALAVAEDAYYRANGSMETINDLIAGIDANEDLKASVDFNTRMLAEIGVILNEQIRLQAAIAQTLGADTVARARDGVAGREFFQTTGN